MTHIQKWLAKGFFSGELQSVSHSSICSITVSSIVLLLLSLPATGKAKHHLLTLHPLMRGQQWHQLKHLCSGLPLEAPSSGPCMRKLVHVHMWCRGRWPCTATGLIHPPGFWQCDKHTDFPPALQDYYSHTYKELWWVMTSFGIL